MSLGLKNREEAYFRRTLTREGFENREEWKEGYEFFGEYFSDSRCVRNYITGSIHDEASLELVKGNV